MAASPVAASTHTAGVCSTPVADSVFKPALLLMAGRTVAFAATFFIPLVLARIFDPAEFGTYKQLFLIWGTVYAVAQLGMASSLYYFLPRAPRLAGPYVANCLVFLAATGFVCVGALLTAAPQLGRWLSNSQLARYLPLIGLYIFLTMFAMALEIVLISRGRYLWASASYAISDVARAAAFIIPALVFRQLEAVLRAVVLLALFRSVVMLFYFRREFRSSFKPDRLLFPGQLAYALPFGLAVLVEIFQASLPQYAVSHLFDPATFAVFAVGCLQIPLVDFAASPTSDVMMVKMQERLAERRMGSVLEIWRDTTWKLALLFFPLATFLMVNAREFIVFLYTTRYSASVPIFAVWSAMILLTTFQVDGVLRVFAQTRLLLGLYLVRLAMIAGLIRWSLAEFHLVGAAMATVLATLIFKAGALIRMKTLLGTRAVDLLPWRSLGSLLAAALCGAIVALAVKSQMRASPLLTILVSGSAHALTYAGLVWRFNLLNDSERVAIAGWLRKIGFVRNSELDYERG